MRFLVRERLAAFMRWLSLRGIDYRSGQTPRQMLQVHLNGAWHVLHSSRDHPLHGKAVGLLGEEVSLFLAERND